jgi:hypothetical protein
MAARPRRGAGGRPTYVGYTHRREKPRYDSTTAAAAADTGIRPAPRSGCGTIFLGTFGLLGWISAARRGLAAGCGWPVRTFTGCLVRALPVVPWTKCGLCCLSLVGPCICWRVGGARDIPVEALFPQRRECFEWGYSSGWSGVWGIDPVDGPPHCDLADEGSAQVASRRCPDWRAVTLAGVLLDLVGEVGN